MFSEVDGLALFVVAAALFFDLWLIAAGERTISQAYQKLLPTWADILMMIPVLAVIVFLPLVGWMKVVLAALAGHVFFPNKETWPGN